MAKLLFLDFSTLIRMSLNKLTFQQIVPSQLFSLKCPAPWKFNLSHCCISYLNIVLCAIWLNTNRSSHLVYTFIYGPYVNYIYRMCHAIPLSTKLTGGKTDNMTLKFRKYLYLCIFTFCYNFSHFLTSGTNFIDRKKVSFTDSNIK